MRGVYAVKFLAEGGYVFNEFVVLWKIVVRSFGKLLIQPFNFFLHLEKMGKSLCRLIENGSFVMGH